MTPRELNRKNLMHTRKQYYKNYRSHFTIGILLTVLVDSSSNCFGILSVNFANTKNLYVQLIDGIVLITEKC